MWIKASKTQAAAQHSRVKKASNRDAVCSRRNAYLTPPKACRANSGKGLQFAGILTPDRNRFAAQLATNNQPILATFPAGSDATLIRGSIRSCAQKCKHF